MNCNCNSEYSESLRAHYAHIDTTISYHTYAINSTRNLLQIAFFLPIGCDSSGLGGRK